MLESFATLDDAVYVVRTLSSQFAKYAEVLSIGHLRPQGREVWTKAIWKSFEHLKNELGTQWRLTDRYLADFGHIHKGEIYILTQLDHDLSKHYVWVAPCRGPFRQGDFVFTEMVFKQE